MRAVIATIASVFCLWIAVEATVVAAATAAASPGTPRLPGGRPDLNGNWVGVTGSTFRVAFPSGEAGKGSINVGIASAAERGFLNQQGRETVGAATRPAGSRANQPVFRDPDELKRADERYAIGNKTDKVAACGHPGLPRVGAPNKIVQTDKELVFLYSDLAGMVWRVVPTDGRGFRDRVDPSFYGDSIGRWQGDTLVVEARGFIDETWFGEYGYTHSDQMKVIERFTRNGNTLTWQATVEDPVMLAKPWVKSPVVLQYTDVQIEEPLTCVPTSYDQGHHQQRTP
jgi:hypothetical protein